MGLFGGIAKTLSGVVDQSIRETLANLGEQMANANGKILQDVLTQLDAASFPRDMNTYLQRSGLTDESLTTLPSLQLMNILSSSNSPLRNLHEQLRINEHLFDTCKSIIDSIKE